jgi:hypothetical protein
MPASVYRLSIALFVCAAVVTTASASKILVNGSPVLNNNYESDTVGGSPSGWTYVGDSYVTDSASPGAYAGSQYLGMHEDPNNSAILDAKIQKALPNSLENGETIRLETMIHMPTVPDGAPWYQMVWADSAAYPGGPHTTPIHSAFFGEANGDISFQYYDGSAYQDTGLTFNAGEWNELIVEYTEGASSWEVSINGSSETIYDFNSRTSNRSIGLIQFHANWASAPNPLLLDDIPEPATLSLLGLGGLAVLRRRRRA